MTGAGPALSGTGGSNKAIGSATGFTYAPWAVSGSTAYHGTGIPVTSFDTLQSNITMVTQFPKETTSPTGFTSWAVGAVDQTTGKSSAILVPWTGTSLWNVALSGSLEAYSVKNCGDLPSGAYTVFTTPTLTAGTWGNGFITTPETTYGPNTWPFYAEYASQLNINTGYATYSSTYNGPTNCPFAVSLTSGTTIAY